MPTTKQQITPTEFSNLDIDFAFEVCLDILKGYIPVTKRSKSFLWSYLNQSYGIGVPVTETPDMTVFVNGQTNKYAGEINNLAGDIQLASVVVRIRKGKGGEVKWDIRESVPDGVNTINLSESRILYDSGAFPEVRINRRITPAQSLDRQLLQLSQYPAKPKEVLIVSYDRLIDEKYVNGDRKKERWGAEEAKLAVSQTVAAAKYLDSQRHRLQGQGLTLVQSCQGVDADQYLRCVKQVLKYCKPGDVLGLGGWCILGRQKSWLPTFWETINLVIPEIASAGIDKVHIFGVTWWKEHSVYSHTPLGSLLWLCNQYGIELTTDGRSPIGNTLWKKQENVKKQTLLHSYWRWNLALVRTVLACLKDRPEYQPPPVLRPVQLRLF